MEKIKFAQICKEDKTICAIAKELWLPFIKEVNEHDEKKQTKRKYLTV